MNDTNHACEVTREEFLALRRELEGRLQSLTVELAKARQRIRQLERAVEGGPAAAGPVGGSGHA